MNDNESSLVQVCFTTLVLISFASVAFKVESTSSSSGLKQALLASSCRLFLRVRVCVFCCFFFFFQVHPCSRALRDTLRRGTATNVRVSRNKMSRKLLRRRLKRGREKKQQ